jgi:hypothetical protein
MSGTSFGPILSMGNSLAPLNNYPFRPRIPEHSPTTFFDQPCALLCNPVVLVGVAERYTIGYCTLRLATLPLQVAYRRSVGAGSPYPPQNFSRNYRLSQRDAAAVRRRLRRRASAHLRDDTFDRWPKVHRIPIDPERVAVRHAVRRGRLQFDGRPTLEINLLAQPGDRRRRIEQPSARRLDGVHALRGHATHQLWKFCSRSKCIGKVSERRLPGIVIFRLASSGQVATSGDTSTNSPSCAWLSRIAKFR